MTQEELYGAELEESPREDDTFTIPKALSKPLEIGSLFEVVGQEERSWIVRPSAKVQPAAAEPEAGSDY